MADYLANIYGTERDKVNCSFFFKIGACRHGERCSRKHVKPAFSQSILICNMVELPTLPEPNSLEGREMLMKEREKAVSPIYEDLFTELAIKYGEVEELCICGNDGDHLKGNVYCQFKYEESAGKAVEDLNNRYYKGRPLYAELSPVTDFREARCRQEENQTGCSRGGFCNFMHPWDASKALRNELMDAQYKMMKNRQARDRRQSQEKVGHDATNEYPPMSA